MTYPISKTRESYQDFEKQMYQRYIERLKQEEKLFEQMEKNYDQIRKDQQSIANAQKGGHWERVPHFVPGTGDVVYTKEWVSDADPKKIKAWNEEIQKLLSDNEKLANELKQLDPSITSIINQIDSAMKKWSDIAYKVMNGDNLSHDLSIFDQMLSALYSYLGHKIKADYDQQLLAEQLKENTDHFDMQLYAKMMSEKSSMANGMGQLEDHLLDAYENFYKEKNTAESDKADKAVWWKNLFGYFTKDIHDDESTIENSDQMLEMIRELEGPIAADAAQASSDVRNPLILLDFFVKRIFEVLEQSGSVQEKKQALENIMFFALSLLTELLGQAALKKGENEKEMEKATKINIELQQSDLIREQNQLDDALKNAQVMGILMKVAQGIMTAVMMACAPGAGSFTSALIMGILAETGVLDQAADGIGDAIHSQVGGDVIVGGLSILVGGGLAMGIDRAALVVGRQMVQASLTVAQEALEQAVTEITEQATQAALQASEQIADEAAQQTAREAARTTAQSAVKNAIQSGIQKSTEQFLRQKVPALVKSGMSGLLRAQLEAIEASAQAAVNQEVIAIAQTAAIETLQVGTTAVTPALMQQAALAGETAGRQALSTSLENAGKWARFKNFLSEHRDAVRAISWGIYGAASTNLLPDILDEAMKKDKDSQEYQILIGILGVINGLLQALSQAGGIGLLESAVEQAVVDISTLMNVASGMQAASTGVSAVAQEQMAETHFKRAHAIEQTYQDQANLSVYQQVLDRILKSSQVHASQDMKDEQVDLERSVELSMHIHDAERVAAQILTHNIV